jgi:glycine/D-amino acid oxidase-like deaminating enzyme
VSAPDVAVIGAGIVGSALAAFLAEAGLRVRVYEREGVAALASGRNSGALQHPMDEAQVPLHTRSLELYAELGHGFELPEPAGVIVLSPHPELLAGPAAEIAARFPELAPERLSGAELTALEPGLAPDLHAYRLETGRPVPPASAARAFAARAQEAGAEFAIGEPATAEVAAGRATGVRVAGRSEPAGAVAVAAGWLTPEALGARAPIVALWGVIVELQLAHPPRHVLEQTGVEDLTGEVESVFSIVTAGGTSAVGSTFLLERPNPDALAPLLLERGARFLPALSQARPLGARACPRPLSLDGRPLLGPIADGLFVASGHGPWGVSNGPGSARLVADAVLGRDEIPPELAAARFA